MMRIGNESVETLTHVNAAEAKNRLRTRFWKIGFVVVLLCFLWGCKSTEYVEVEKVRDVYHNSVDTLRDSVYHDVYRNVYLKGDTVYSERVEYVYKDRWRVRRDTVVVRDSVCATSRTIEKKDVVDRIEDGISSLVAALFLICVFVFIIYYTYYLARKKGN